MPFCWFCHEAAHLYLYQLKGENGRRNYFMIHLHESYVAVMWCLFVQFEMIYVLSRSTGLPIMARWTV